MNTVTVEVDLDEVDISPSGMDGDILHRKVIDKDGEKVILVGYLWHDQDQDNPCDNDDGMGHMYSFNRRHINFLDPDEIPSKIAKRHRKFAVPLSYYEHGLCLWDVQGGERYGMCPDKQWDGVGLAGIWVPNDNLLDCMYGEYRHWKKKNNLTKVSKEDREKKYAEIMRMYAKQACETYTDWANGETYGYSVETFDALGNEIENLDTCGGYIGRKWAEEEVEEAFNRYVPE